MNPQQAKQTVLVAMIALIGISVYRQKADPGTLYKRVWGTGVLGVFLSLIADFAPTIAGPFAVVTVLGALTHGGDEALVNLFGGGGTGPGTGSSARTGSGKTGGGSADKPPYTNSKYQPGGSHYATGLGRNPATGRAYKDDPNWNPNATPHH